MVKYNSDYILSESNNFDSSLAYRSAETPFYMCEFLLPHGTNPVL
jgi:hypothetical protein